MCVPELTDKNARMPDDLEHRILLIRKNQQSFVSDEQATRQGAVLPLLGRLGWDRDDIDEVKPEFGVGERKVDYALFTNSHPLVFIEAVRGGEELVKRADRGHDGSRCRGRMSSTRTTDRIAALAKMPNVANSGTCRSRSMPNP